MKIFFLFFFRMILFFYALQPFHNIVNTSSGSDIEQALLSSHYKALWAQYC